MSLCSADITQHRIPSLAQLTAFAVAAEAGSLTRAAEALHISQPAVSELLRRLELELDAQLIQRRGRPFQLTVEGELLLPFATLAVEAARHGAEAVRAHR